MTAGTLDAGKLCDLLANPELLPEAARPVVQSTLADVFWFLGVEMEAGAGKEDAKAQLVGLIKELLREKVVDDKLLLTRLDGPMLQDAGLVDDAKEFHKQQVRVNTKALYTQQKYNLLREQSGGVLEAGGRALGAPGRRRLDLDPRDARRLRGDRQHPEPHRLL